jgi:LacI family transcriptional regulator
MGLHTTIKDVAKRAGVSIATVSFVMNEHPNQTISGKVRERVFAAARHLDYHPRASAVGLAGRRTRNVGMVFYRDTAAVSNQFHSHVIKGALLEATQRNYNMLFCFQEATYKGPSDLPKIIREKNTEGVFFVHRISPPMIRDIQARGIAVIALDAEPAMRKLETIDFDARRGGVLAAEHLIELGHRNIGVVVGALEQPSIQSRVQGFRDGCQRRGVAWGEQNLFVCDGLHYLPAYERTKEALQGNKNVTALFCVNDLMAAGALRAAHEVGLRVPRDLSVIGFDDIEMGNYLDPPLTTIHVDKVGLGKRGIARLVEIVETQDTETGGAAPTAFGKETMPVDLVVRESTARLGPHP